MEEQHNPLTHDAAQPHPAYRIEIYSAPLPQQLMDSLTALAQAAAQQDGHPPFAEQTLVDLKHHSPAKVFTLSVPGAAQPGSTAAAGPQLQGAAVLNGSTLEFVIAPDYRGQGLGRALAAQALQACDAEPDLGVWRHGEHPAADQLAADFGFQPRRELWKMACPAGTRFPDVVLPAGVRLESYQGEQQLSALVELNTAAFADHPEQGALTEEDFRARMASDWFDASGLLLAVTEQGQILGFHWTKIDPHAAADTGEVYVVGVSPQAQGRGLGKALTVAGLEYLGSRVKVIELYVDADNSAATALYQQLGFQLSSVDVLYRRKHA